jgi:hypothetical protein
MKKKKTIEDNLKSLIERIKAMDLSDRFPDEVSIGENCIITDHYVDESGHVVKVFEPLPGDSRDSN